MRGQGLADDGAAHDDAPATPRPQVADHHLRNGPVDKGNVTLRLRVLALTPRIGGHVFGELLSGLAREVATADGRLVVVQTLKPSTLGGDIGDIGEPGAVGGYDLPVAWSVVDGVVSALGAVGAPYLHRLRDQGIPVVLTARVDGFEVPVALPDNSGGTFATVEHLVEHGHATTDVVRASKACCRRPRPKRGCPPRRVTTRSGGPGGSGGRRR